MTASGDVCQEREYAEAEGFFSVAGRVSSAMATEIKSHQAAQNAKFEIPAGADKPTKKELENKRGAAEVTLIKARR